jgi:hypothetical protein
MPMKRKWMKSGLGLNIHPENPYMPCTQDQGLKFYVSGLLCCPK